MSDIITVSQRYYVNEVLKRSTAYMFDHVKKGHLLKIEIPIVKPEKSGAISYATFINESTGESDVKPLGRGHQILRSFDLRKVPDDFKSEGITEVFKRVTKTQYYLDIALAVSRRSTCLRRRYGAVIVNGESLVATGYNGAPRGEDNCIDLGVCYREENKIPHGSEYEKCRAVHAEMNAITMAFRGDLISADLYLAGEDNVGELVDAEPCAICSKMIKNAGIKSVITRSEKKDTL